MINTNKRLLIVSGYIEGKPTGGVAMHVHRLLIQLIEPNYSNYDLCDYKKEGLFLQLKKIYKADVMHIHASNPYLKCFYVLVGKILRTKTILTLHGRYGVFGKWKNLFNKWALKYCDAPVLINSESYTAVKMFNKAAVLMSAFIPPIKEEEVLSSDIEMIMRNLKKESIALFITNASSRSFTVDGQEIYGIQFLICFFSKHPEFSLIVFDPEGYYHQMYNKNLPNNVVILTGKHSFCGAMELSDIIIRNTPVDGDSFSVKEALYYHKRVLATDSVSRPDGVFLFKYNDEQSFVLAITHALTYNGVVELKEENALQHYLRLYSCFGVNLVFNDNDVHLHNS